MLLKSMLHLLMIKQKIRNQIYTPLLIKEVPYGRKQWRKRSWCKSWKKLRKYKKGKKTLQCFTEKKDCLFDFLAFVHFLKSILSGYNTRAVARNTLIFAWFHWYKVSKFPWKILWFFCKKSVGTRYDFFSNSKSCILDGLCVSLKTFSEQVSLKKTCEQQFLNNYLQKSQS